MSGQQQSASPSETLTQRLDIRLTLRAAKLGIWELDGSTGLVNWDDQCRSLFGFASDNQVPYDAAVDCIHPDDVPWVNKAIDAILTRQTNDPYDVVYRINRADNRALRWIHSVGEAYFTPTGELIRFIGVNQDVTDQQSLARSEAQLRTIIDAAPIAIGLFVGPDMTLATINQPFIDVVGKGPAIVGKPLREVIPEPENQPFLSMLDNVYATRQPFYGSALPTRIIRNGIACDEFYNISYIPLPDANGQTYAILGIAVDVTQQQQQQQLLEQLVELRTQELVAVNEELTAGNEELEEANTLLTRLNDNLQTFAYIASHDLQEPLRKIQQFGDLLDERLTDTADSDVRFYLERMRVAASRMSLLIRDLLSFSRVSTQRGTSESVSLQAVVGRVIDVLDLVITEKQAQLQVDALPTLPGDPVQLEQLVQNLLTNALKFQQTDPATGVPVPPRIRISAQLLMADELPEPGSSNRRTSAYYRIDVTDNGIGFDEKYLNRIFQVFQRLHNRGEFTGTGVGLAICERVVANHGGMITARSQPGKGTTFEVYLPAD